MEKRVLASQTTRSFRAPSNQTKAMAAPSSAVAVQSARPPALPPLDRTALPALAARAQKPVVFAAADVGGTNLRVLMIDVSGATPKVVAKVHVPTEKGIDG